MTQPINAANARPARERTPADDDRRKRRRMCGGTQAMPNGAADDSRTAQAEAAPGEEPRGLETRRSARRRRERGRQAATNPEGKAGRNLTIRQVATELGVSERTVRRWIKYGHLRTWGRGRVVRIPRSALIALVVAFSAVSASDREDPPESTT